MKFFVIFVKFRNYDFRRNQILIMNQIVIRRESSTLLTSTPKTPQFRLPLSSTHPSVPVYWTERFLVLNWGVFGAELKGVLNWGVSVWNWREGGTEGFLVWNWGGWNWGFLVWNRCVEVRGSVWNWGLLLKTKDLRLTIVTSLNLYGN